MENQKNHFDRYGHYINCENKTLSEIWKEGYEQGQKDCEVKFGPENQRYARGYADGYDDGLDAEKQIREAGDYVTA